MLVAVAVVAAALLLIATLGGRVRRASSVADASAYRAQIRAAASTIVGGELRRAGPAPDGTPSELALAPPHLAIALGAPGADAITVRYLDAGFRSAPAPREVEISAGRDGRGRPALYLRVGDASRQPALERVVGLEVASLLKATGAAPPTPGTVDGVLGAVVRLTYSWGEASDVAVPFGSPLTAVVR